MSYLSLILITINVANLDEVMMVLHKRELEKSILAGIDRLVHVLIDLSCTDGRLKNDLLEQAIQMVRDIIPHLLVLLGGKEEHLETLLRQLISQKLPPGLALDSFGPLKRDLDTILTLAFYRDSLEETLPIPTELPVEAPVTELISDAASLSEEVKPTSTPTVSAGSGHDFALLLQCIFPASTIHQGYLFRSLYLDYYLPEQSLAILVTYPGVRTIPSVEQLLKKERITLLKLQPSELEHPSLLARKLLCYK